MYTGSNYSAISLKDAKLELLARKYFCCGYVFKIEIAGVFLLANTSHTALHT